MKKQDSGGKDLLALITDTVIGVPAVTAGLNIYERITTKKKEKAKKSIEEFVLGVRSLTQAEIQKIADDIDKNGDDLLETLLEVVFELDNSKKINLLTCCFKKYINQEISKDDLLDLTVIIEKTKMLYLYQLKNFKEDIKKISPIIMENLVANGLIIRNFETKSEVKIGLQKQATSMKNLEINISLSNHAQIIIQALEETQNS